MRVPLAEGYLEPPVEGSFPKLKMNPQNVCYWLERLFRAFVFLSCLGIVSWQCLRCLTKFLSKPQVTRLSIVNSGGNLFPSVTICPQPDPKEKTGYNSTILEECGIALAQYHSRGSAVWSNQAIESCRDPEALYYNVWNIWKPKDLIPNLHIKTFNRSKTVFLGNDNSLFSPVDIRNHGRCYTFLPPVQSLKDGIYEIFFSVKANARVFINNNGVLGVKTEAENKFVDISLNTTTRVNVEHSLYKVLDFQGSPCNNEKTYQLDKCVLDALENESLKSIGCVSPFGIIAKDKICKDKQDAKKTFRLYKRFQDNYLDIKNLSCHEPCSYMNIHIFKASEVEGHGYLRLRFNKKVQEAVAYYSYDDLSFIAEIGGYVGLFLGASFYQTADLFQFITGVLQKFFR